MSVFALRLPGGTLWPGGDGGDTFDAQIRKDQAHYLGIVRATKLKVA
jgi:hypothetical protein